MKLIREKTAATDVVSRDVVINEVNTDAGAYSKLGWLILLVGFGGFILWGLIAPLDQGVPAQGTLTVAGNRKAVQHQSGGTVDAILVKEGDRVKAGQVLVRMNEVVNKSAAESSRGQYIAARLTEARLLAERDGRSSITMPASLEKYKSDPRVAEVLAAQNMLLMSRQSALRNELGALDESMSGLKQQIAGLQESRESKKLQQKMLKEELEGMRDLAKEGYVARNRLFDIERTYAQVSGSISEDIGNIGRSQRQVTELALRRIQRQQEYQKEVRTQLSDVQSNADALSNRLQAQDYELANTEVKSPADGIIVGMNVFTQGGVVSPGFRMMDVVPVEDALVVEGQLPVHLIDKVHVGLPVELIFSAFNQNKTPHIQGVISQVSADRFTDEHSGMPYYRMKAKVTPEGMRKITKLNLQLRPGMPVDLFVKTGERTMMSYLFKPIMDRARTSMTEE
jgi:protease secretion system membrane fusion protein